jgi:undecaprenyl-diphosphatase
MNALLLIKAIVLGILEGLTEFIPVSSTGHLILGADWLHFDVPSANLFEVVIQLGAILAVCWLYRARLTNIVLHLNKKPERMFALKLIVAFLPAAFIGLAFHHFITTVLFSPLVVAVMLIAGGAAIWATEKFRPAPDVTDIGSISLRRAFLIGCALALSVIPGTSRSGATIVGGLWLKLDRKAATEFSFFLAIPTMFAATGYDFLKNMTAVGRDDLILIAAGFIAAFFSGLAAVKFFIGFVGRRDMVPFALYRILFGVFMLWFYI